MIFKDLSIKYDSGARPAAFISYKYNSVEVLPSKRLLSRLAACAVALASAVVALPAAAWPAAADQAASSKNQRRAGVVSRVIDGDTVWLAPSGKGKPVKVRINGIDAPEICQAGGVASRDALAGRVLGKSVLMAVPASRSRDDYGRVLGALEFNGEDIGRWMVQSGHAWSYSYQRRPGVYASEQLLARQTRRGLFGDPRAEEPRRFRQRNGSCYAYGHAKPVVLQ